MASFSLLLCLLFSLFTPIFSQPQYPKGFLIDCGATSESPANGGRWLPDSEFISSGTPQNISLPGLLPPLSTVRTFPYTAAATKFCYVVPVLRNRKYLIRTTYFYGRFDGRNSPPVFNQIVDGTVWSVVNTTEDYSQGLSSYYEGVFLAKGKTMSICVGRNKFTDSEMFISALELLLLGNSLYNSTDFGKYGLATIARHNFGYRGSILRFPEDHFDRFWGPFTDNNVATNARENVSISGFWNLPPSTIFDTALSTNQLEAIELQWPPVSLPNSTYYIALYFAKTSESSSDAFSVSINGIKFYENLKPTPDGVVVFATQWPLSGLTKVTLTPAAGSNVGPMINAGEIFDIVVLGRTTVTRDVIALEGFKKNLQNPPIDWNGDPCLPHGYSWTGITCSEGKLIRIVSLNLSSLGLSGTLSPSIANLTALTDIFLQNNNLSGEVPSSLTTKPGLNLQTSGNRFSPGTATPPS
ncbi:hypothetical protein ACLOJK_026029 [Asimina triloba]